MRNDVCRKIILVSVLGSTLLLPGCATIRNGGQQQITLKTEAVDGAAITGIQCELSNAKGNWFVTTPGSVKIKRSSSDLNVKCVDDQWNMRDSFAAKSSSNFFETSAGPALGGLVVGGVVGNSLATGPWMGGAPAMFGVIGAVVGGVAGGTVDAMTGAAYQYPAEISIVLQPKASTVSTSVESTKKN